MKKERKERRKYKKKRERKQGRREGAGGRKKEIGRKERRKEGKKRERKEGGRERGRERKKKRKKLARMWRNQNPPMHSWLLDGLQCRPWKSWREAVPLPRGLHRTSAMSRGQALSPSSHNSKAILQ